MDAVNIFSLSRAEQDQADLTIAAKSDVVVIRRAGSPAI